MVWFGIAVAGVGPVLLAAPELALTTQILPWSALSAALVAIWFGYLEPRTMTAIGTSAARLAGEVGILVSSIAPDTDGQVRFPKPILGADLWECHADTAINTGDRVRIVAVEGSYIKVQPAKCKPGGDRWRHPCGTIARRGAERTGVASFQERNSMNTGWIVFGICIVFVLGGAIPLIRDRGAGRTPPLQRKETLRDWRNEK